jgi:hypothetical protein
MSDKSRIFLLAIAGLLLTGCVVREGGGYDRGYYDRGYGYGDRGRYEQRGYYDNDHRGDHYWR